jgi:hypothetical protein
MCRTSASSTKKKGCHRARSTRHRRNMKRNINSPGTQTKAAPIAGCGRSRCANAYLYEKTGRCRAAEKKHHLPMLGRPPPSRSSARTVGDKPISCVERCTQRSRARYGRLSARIAVSRPKRACCIKGKATQCHRRSIRGAIFHHVDPAQMKSAGTSAKQRGRRDGERAATPVTHFSGLGG